jgi:hypothetical protein
MNLFKIYLCPALLVTMLGFNCGKPKPITIIPIHSLEYTDNTQVYKHHRLLIRTEFYIVQNYKDNPANDHYIDSFVTALKQRNTEKYDIYAINFYRESSKTNIERIKREPKIIYRYSQEHDLIHLYQYHKQELSLKHKVREGEFLE